MERFSRVGGRKGAHRTFCGSKDYMIVDGGDFTIYSGNAFEGLRSALVDMGGDMHGQCRLEMLVFASDSFSCTCLEQSICNSIRTSYIVGARAFYSVTLAALAAEPDDRA